MTKIKPFSKKILKPTITVFITLFFLGLAIAVELGQTNNIDISDEFTQEEKDKLTQYGLDQDTYELSCEGDNCEIKLGSRYTPIRYKTYCSDDIVDKNGTVTQQERDCTTQELIAEKEKQIVKYKRHKIEVYDNSVEQVNTLIEQGEVIVN